jgi:putative sterol carrier protein
VSSSEKAKLKVERSGRWARVYAEVGGKDASHLFYDPQKVQLGRDSTVTLAGIGGVGTAQEHRRKGLAAEVLRHALLEMQHGGYNAVGLYTSGRIVAHRLYRRCGFVDVCRRQPACKLLDPPALARRVLTDVARRSPELQSHSLTLALSVDAGRPSHLRIDGQQVSLLSHAPRAVDLALKMSGRTLLKLWLGETTLPDALAAKLATWAGDEGALQLLVRAANAASTPVGEG